MQSVTYILFSFGPNTLNHLMANFSILSVKKFDQRDVKIVVYTDKPESYEYLKNFLIIRNLDEKTLKDWLGPFNFLWRVKIMAMLDCAIKDEGHLIYLDSDTFATKDLSAFYENLDSGNCMMHVKEGLISEDKSKNKTLLWNQTKNKKFGNLLVDEKSEMWNAGLVALPKDSKLQLINSALLSTDEMCAQKVEPWLVEQFSLSQSLRETGKLIPADNWFAHYWGNKEKVLQEIQIFLSILLIRKIDPKHATELINISEWKTHLIRPTKKSFLKKWLRF